VGNAVYRNRAKRILRALILEHEDKLPLGEYVFVAKEGIFSRDSETRKKDFFYSMKKLGLF